MESSKQNDKLGCPNAKAGCMFLGNEDELKDHINNEKCNFVEEKCDKCGIILLKKEMTSHPCKIGYKKTKKLSNKEIFRILAFEYKQSDLSGIKISIISEMVSNLFYPYKGAAEEKAKFKALIESSFKNYMGFNDEINEEQFCQAMNSVEKYINPETTERFLKKLFRRHDKDKDGLLNREEFKQFLTNYNDEKLTVNDIDKIYDQIALGEKGIEMKNFIKHCM